MQFEKVVEAVEKLSEPYLQIEGFDPDMYRVLITEYADGHSASLLRKFRMKKLTGRTHGKMCDMIYGALRSQEDVDSFLGRLEYRLATRKEWIDGLISELKRRKNIAVELSPVPVLDPYMTENDEEKSARDTDVRVYNMAYSKTLACVPSSIKLFDLASVVVIIPQKHQELGSFWLGKFTKGIKRRADPYGDFGFTEYRSTFSLQLEYQELTPVEMADMLCYPDDILYSFAVDGENSVFMPILRGRSRSEEELLETVMKHMKRAELSGPVYDFENPLWL